MYFSIIMQLLQLLLMNFPLPHNFVLLYQLKRMKQFNGKYKQTNTLLYLYSYLHVHVD